MKYSFTLSLLCAAMLALAAGCQKRPAVSADPGQDDQAMAQSSDQWAHAQGGPTGSDTNIVKPVTEEPRDFPLPPMTEDTTRPRPLPPVSRDPVKAEWPKSHVIVRGDTLYSLAKRHYGDGRLYTKILKANPEIDPNKLIVGDSIQIPAP